MSFDEDKKDDPKSTAEEARRVLGDPENVRRLAKQVMVRCERAREDIVEFMEFVLVTEHTRERFKVAPHQHIMLDFMLKHSHTVSMVPVSHGKSFLTSALAIYMLGRDPTLRGAIVSATQDQAQKPMIMIRDYIENSAKLRAVFPDLRPSTRPGDPWTQSKITVQRPPGIRDASLIAIGIDGAIAGARLSWIVVDDILNMENTGTPEQRAKVYNWFDSTVLSRLDPVGGRIIVINTAWHPDDLVHHLAKTRKEGGAEWATLRMQITGEIEVKTPDIMNLDGTSTEDRWGIDDEIAKQLRPATPNKNEQMVRLVANDDPTKTLEENNTETLWPKRFDRAQVNELRRKHLPHQFNQLYMNICRDDDTALCKLEWIEACMEAARNQRIFEMTSSYNGGNPLVFTGVDLAVSPGEEHDDTAFFTFEVLPGGFRKILDIDVGQMDGPQIVDKIIAKQKLYNSVVRVENVGAQEYILQFIRQRDASVPLNAHTTGRTKAHPEYGVMGLFIELKNGAWLIPNRGGIGDCHPAVKKFIDACLYYSPSKHTADVLMASYFAREQAKEYGVLSGGEAMGGGGSISMAVMSR